MSLQTFLLIFLWLAPLLVRSQFPRACTTDNALDTRECCPVVIDSSGSSKCGEVQGRGFCDNVISPAAGRELKFKLLLDDRIEWPNAFYDKICRCNANYDGVNCGKCKPGYVGIYCQEKRPLVIRQNIKMMSSVEVDTFIRSINKSKYTTSENYVVLTTSYDRILAGEAPAFSNITIYNLFVWMHYYISRSNFAITEEVYNNLTTDVGPRDFTNIPLENLQRFLNNSSNLLVINNDLDYAHEGPSFLPWHRYFLLKWEEEIRNVVLNSESFGLPYWDWTASQDCDMCSDEYFGGRNPSDDKLLSEGSVFSQWDIICTKLDQYTLNGQQCAGEKEGPLLRNFGNYDPQRSSDIPTREEVEQSLRFSTYDTFPYDNSSNQSFRNILEGFADSENGTAPNHISTLHNAIHLYMNGTMSLVPSSANDPLFLVHHVFIDSIYERWLQDKRNSEIFSPLVNIPGTKVGHRLHDFMVPFFPLVRQVDGFQRSEELGYRYDYIGSKFENESILDQSNHTNDLSGFQEWEKSFWRMSEMKQVLSCPPVILLLALASESYALFYACTTAFSTACHFATKLRKVAKYTEEQGGNVIKEFDLADTALLL
uniref:Tyrosinase n=2 Tax=Halocynthia roretzi TaxID=7729 RepID=Q868D0_HALRO|nr:tyrosinase [Halocynthia roretzi]